MNPVEAKYIDSGTLQASEEQCSMAGISKAGQTCYVLTKEQWDGLKQQLDEANLAYERMSADCENLSVKLAEAGRQLDESIGERDACHKCWDEFVEKLQAKIPDLNRRPLFQQSEVILAVIRRLESALEARRAGAAVIEGSLRKQLSESQEQLAAKTEELERVRKALDTAVWLASLPEHAWCADYDDLLSDCEKLIAPTTEQSSADGGVR